MTNTTDPRWFEALPHQRVIMEEIDRLGHISSENETEAYRKARAAVDQILNSPKLGELMEFENWANVQLGYECREIDGIWRWRKAKACQAPPA